MRKRLVIAGWLLWLPMEIRAMDADRALSVTIYADDLALVQDRREVEVKGGRQRIDEEVEINVGDSPDVRVAAEKETTSIDPRGTHVLPLVPGITLRSAEIDTVNRVDVSNARATEIQLELKLELPAGGRVVRADHPLGTKNGRPIFRLTIPPNETVTLRYQTQHTVG